VDKLRDFFDRKMADVSRRENLAEKLAQEWEEHLELTVQKEEILQSDGETDNASFHALDSAIKYREERIRQLASRLGKRQKRSNEHQTNDEVFIFNKEFNEIVGTKALSNGADIVAKVLFGMVVRERRRIASLARTASSLDEKVQETESALADKEAAFNAYVGEQRLNAASLAQNQQKHILSLMEIVKEGHAEESDKVISSPSRKKHKPSSLEDGKSRLLILANERIDALENQLSETQLVQDAVQMHQEREQSAMARLVEKTKECEDLLDEVDDLRCALRSIQAEVTVDKNFTSLERDTTQRSPSTAVRDIVTGALHPTSVSTAGKLKRRRSSIKSLRGRAPLFCPGSVESDFDSSDSEEVPDWAEDIMADLAIIAAGKMPSSLLQSQEVLEAEAQLNRNNVFERLTNPQSFTGVQKQKNVKTNRATRKIDTSESFYPPDEKDKKNEKTSKKSKEKLSKESDSTRRTVFDRLLSPSNLTGTQKQRFNRIQDKKGRTLEKAIENQHVSVRGRSRVTEYDPEESEDDDIDHLLANSIGSSIGSGVTEKRNETYHSSKRDDYKRLDVFERLNKTTTQAYKEKVHTNIAEKMLDEILSDEDVSVDFEESSKFSPSLDRVKEYASQNVFERLQTTTTEAYSKKKNNGVEDPNMCISPNKKRLDRTSAYDAPGLNLSAKNKKNVSE